MAKVLTTHSTAAAIENIILNSKKELTLVSPYLQLSRTFFDRLKEADERGVKVIIVYGKDELKPELKTQLGKLRNMSLCFCENVHAKCYANEESMVITSMNMYEFSEKNNREMGVLISANNDNDLYINAYREVRSIISISVHKNNSIKENQPLNRPSIQKSNPIREAAPIVKTPTQKSNPVWENTPIVRPSTQKSNLIGEVQPNARTSVQESKSLWEATPIVKTPIQKNKFMVRQKQQREAHVNTNPPKWHDMPTFKNIMSKLSAKLNSE